MSQINPLQQSIDALVAEVRAVHADLVALRKAQEVQSAALVSLLESARRRETQSVAAHL